LKSLWGVKPKSCGKWVAEKKPENEGKKREKQIWRAGLKPTRPRKRRSTEKQLAEGVMLSEVQEQKNRKKKEEENGRRRRKELVFSTKAGLIELEIGARRMKKGQKDQTPV